MVGHEVKEASGTGFQLPGKKIRKFMILMDLAPIP